MKVRAMRVRARPGQRRMVARHKWHRALDTYSAGIGQALVDSHNNFTKAVNAMFRGVLLEAIRPVVVAVARTAAPGLSAAVGGPTTSAFAARKWSGQP